MAEPQNKSDDNPKSVYESLNGIQKSAILMMLLGEEEAAEIIKNLGPREVQARRTWSCCFLANYNC